MKVQIVDGPCVLSDLEAVRVGAWRNPRLVEASASHPEIEPYRTTILTTVNAVQREAIPTLKAHVAKGGDPRDLFIVARLNVNGESNPRTAFVGETLKLVQINPAIQNGEAVMHGPNSPMAGLPVMQARVIEFYPPPKVEEVDLDELLAETEPVKPVATESGKATGATDTKGESTIEMDVPQDQADLS